MITPDPLRILYCAPSPIDSPAPVRTERESSALLAAARSSNKSVWLGGIVPGSIENIELSGVSDSPFILHLAAHAGQHEVELEDRSGALINTSGSAVATALVASDAQIIVLNGCDTERIGRAVAKISPAVAIICTTGFLPDEVAVRFVEIFYPLLLAIGDVARSFESTVRALNESFVHAPYFLFERGPAVKLIAGNVIVDQSFIWARARAQLRTIWGRRRELLDLYPFLSGASAPIQWVTGAPLAGISTFLRAAGTQYAWMFRHSPIYLDLRSVSNIHDIDDKVCTAVGITSAATPFDEVLLRYSVLLIFDHYDRIAPALSKEIFAKLGTLPDSCPSRVMIGTGPLPDASQMSQSILSLGELEPESALSLLSSKIGSEKAQRFRQVLGEMPRLPGRIVTLANDIKNGAEDAHLKELINNGDPRSGLDRVVGQLLENPHISFLVKSLLDAGQRVPRSAARAAFFALENVDLTNPQSNFNEVFEQSVTALREFGLIWIDEVQILTGGIPEAYFCSSPDFLHVARIQCPIGSPSEKVDALQAFVKVATERAAEGRVNTFNDAQWIGHIARSCYKNRMPEYAAELGHVFLHRDAPFRLTGTGSELETLSLAAFEAARELGQTDFSSYLSLVLGESYYRSGQLDKAEDVFRRGLTLDSSVDRKLQMLRALGQISYRRGHYEAALALYDQARTYATGASPDFVATLDHHRAKALFRLGEYDEAIQELGRVIDFRRNVGDLRGMIKAQHEVARIFQKKGSFSEAEQMYQLVMLGAETEQFEKLLPAPLYQLCLLELHRGNIESASRYQLKCSVLADRISDPLWQSLAELALGMIAFQRGDFDLSARCIENAIDSARLHGFSQVISDAKDWIRNQTASQGSASVTTKESTADFLGRFVGLNANKAMKALRYSKEPERISRITVEFQSDSENRKITWISGQWSCDCKLFLSNQMCSHIVALILMGDKLWKLPDIDQV